MNRYFGIAVLVIISIGVIVLLVRASRVNRPSPMMTGDQVDRNFIIQMIPHHDGAIAMARIALTRSKRPEILSLANGIIEAQEREIAEMKQWYQEWYGAPVPEIDAGGGMGHGAGGMHMDSMSGDIDALSAASDAEFDRVFITQMIPHHEMAVMMAQMLQSGTGREEMKTLADAISTSQSREIKMMRSWRDAWYPN